MSVHPWRRILVVLLAIGAAITALVLRPVRLGLDLRERRSAASSFGMPSSPPGSPWAPNSCIWRSGSDGRTAARLSWQCSTMCWFCSACLRGSAKEIDGVRRVLLTVIGYSVNDSVVVFDRIREQRRLQPNEPFAGIANDACLHTVPRTINTGLGALFILLMLCVFGGDTLWGSKTLIRHAACRAQKLGSGP